METDTFPKEHVQKAFARMVAAKIDATKNDKDFKANQGKGVPLLLLLDPTGKVRVRCDGKPQQDLLEALANDLYNAGVPQQGNPPAAFEEWGPIVELFPDTPVAAQVRDVIKRWEADPAIKKQLDAVRAKWACEPALKAADAILAQRNRSAKKTEEARALLDRIVADFPDSPYAAQAQERLAKLPPKAK